jgi:hypothetical protein
MRDEKFHAATVIALLFRFPCDTEKFSPSKTMTRGPAAPAVNWDLGLQD